MRYYILFDGGQALRIAIGITVLGLLLAGAAGAATLTVDDSGNDAQIIYSTMTHTVCPSGCDFTGIQAAINAANPGDTIQVYSGTYYENVLVNKTLNLIGIGSPVVNAGGSGNAITLETVNSLLEGFTVTNAKDGIRIGKEPQRNIFYGLSNNVVKNNNASNNAHSGIEIGCYSQDDTRNTTLIH